MEKARYEALRGWMLRSARPLDLARFRFLFEDGSVLPVLEALSAYQNADGGFGHALEPDNWSPQSMVLPTWYATFRLKEIGFEDGGHPIIQGILRYLEEGAEFQDGIWPDTTPAVNDAPHAPWWTYTADVRAVKSYNPTASLAGFIIRFAPAGSALLRKAEDIAWQAVEAFYASKAQEMHELPCYMALADYCEDAGRTDLFEIGALREAIAGWVGQVVEQDASKWETAYVCRPSQFVQDRASPYYPALREAAEAEVGFLLRTQRPDGTWPVTWQWNAYPEAWPISKHWWTANIAIENLRTLKGFDAL